MTENKDNLNGNDGNDDTEAPFVVAKRYAQLYGSIPASFSTSIRRLVAEEEARAISSSSLWQMKRFLRSESMQAPLYFALKTFHASKLEENKAFAPQDMAKFFSPFELASILGVLYLFRRARAICDKEEWGQLVEPLQQWLELAAAVGGSMPRIGLGTGILVGAMRHLAMAPLLMHNKNVFRDYRISVKSSKARFNLEREHAKWGCSHVEIASNLLIHLGFGPDFAASFRTGLSMETLSSENNDRVAYGVKICDLWAESLYKSGNPPDIPHSGNYYPLKEELSQLKEAAAQITRCGSLFHWLERGKADLSPDVTPELFASGSPKEGEVGGNTQTEEGEAPPLPDEFLE